MARNSSSVGVARFYDWSEQAAADKDDYPSVSRLYREIAIGGTRASSLSRVQSERVRGPWPAANNGQWSTVPSPPGTTKTRMSPGRMFLRDKGMLTKGEREIIEGIYKNRGDLRRDPAGVKSEYVVRSHHDAWLVGKHYRLPSKPSTDTPRHHRGSLCEGPGDVMMAASGYSVETPRTGAPSEGHTEEHSSVTCVMCLSEKQQRLHAVSQKQNKISLSPPSQIGDVLSHATSVHDAVTSSKGSQEPVAPPSSPNGMSSRMFLIPSPPLTSIRPSRGGEYDTKRPDRPPQDSHLPCSDAKTSDRNAKTSSDRIAKITERANKTLSDRTARTSTERTAKTSSEKTTRASSERTTRVSSERTPKISSETTTKTLSDRTAKTSSERSTNTPEWTTKISEWTANISEQSEVGLQMEEEEEVCGHSQTSPNSDDSRRRLHVKVFLPKVTAEPVVDDLKAGLLQGRPLLAREKPLSYHDLKPKENGEQTELGTPEDKSDFQSQIVEGRKNREEVKDTQCHSASAKQQTSLGSEDEAFVDGSDPLSSVTNKTMSALSAAIEDWRLVDE